MGPLELQLVRELAIDLVRQCAERLARDGDDAAPDLVWYQHWFVDQYERWLSTDHPSLGGRTPLSVITDERNRLGRRLQDPLTDPVHLELYTDLPQIEHWRDATSSAAPPGPRRPEPRSGSADDGVEQVRSDRSADAPAVEDAAWRAFCSTHLAGWLEP